MFRGSGGDSLRECRRWSARAAPCTVAHLPDWRYKGTKIFLNYQMLTHLFSAIWDVYIKCLLRSCANQKGGKSESRHLYIRCLLNICTNQKIRKSESRHLHVREYIGAAEEMVSLMLILYILYYYYIIYIINIYTIYNNKYLSPYCSPSVPELSNVYFLTFCFSVFSKWEVVCVRVLRHLWPYPLRNVKKQNKTERQAAV